MSYEDLQRRREARRWLIDPQRQVVAADAWADAVVLLTVVAEELRRGTRSGRGVDQARALAILRTIDQSTGDLMRARL